MCSLELYAGGSIFSLSKLNNKTSILSKFFNALEVGTNVSDMVKFWIGNQEEDQDNRHEAQMPFNLIKQISGVWYVAKGLNEI